MCMRGKDLQLGFRTDPVFRNRFDLMCETINGLRVFLLLVVFLVLLLL